MPFGTSQTLDQTTVDGIPALHSAVAGRGYGSATGRRTDDFGGRPEEEGLKK